MNQRGFATLEVILMVMVIGILASIAIPRFGDVTTRANTAKIQADLSTLDSAIAIYYMENGKYPIKLSDLKNHVNGVETDNKPDLKPPTGSAYIEGTAKEIPSGGYVLKQVSGTDEETGVTERRAYLGTYTAEKFYK